MTGTAWLLLSVLGVGVAAAAALAGGWIADRSLTAHTTATTPRKGPTS